jgi:hypothetical protein
MVAKHPEKTTNGRIKKGFDFLGYVRPWPQYQPNDAGHPVDVGLFGYGSRG